MNLPAKSVGTIANIFEGAVVQAQLKKALPQFLTVDKLIRIMLTVIRQTPKLQKCSQQSLLACLFGCGQLGLTPEPWLGQAYLVPFWSSKLNCNEAVLIPGYRGLIALAKRSGEIVNVAAEAVFENDEFDYDLGTNGFIKHKKALRDPGELIAAWTEWKYVPQFSGDTGAISRGVMPIWRIDEIMEKTKSRDKKKNIVGPWITDKAEMARKSIIRNHFKYAPVSVEKQSGFARAIQAESAAIEGGPAFQQDMFLSDTDLSADPLEITGNDEDFTVEDFDKEFSSLAQIKLFDDFCNAAFTAGNYATIDDLKLDVMKSGLADAFRHDFEKYQVARKKKQPKKETKPKATRPTGKGAKKTTPKGATGEGKNQPGADAGDDRPEFDRLVESDMWQELTVLKSKYPEFYKEVSGGEKPRTFKACENMIDEVEFKAQGS
jgi:recombination protein RecT